nr:unnamed protein product [Homo sapiens]
MGVSSVSLCPARQCPADTQARSLGSAALSAMAVSTRDTSIRARRPSDSKSGASVSAAPARLARSPVRSRSAQSPPVPCLPLAASSAQPVSWMERSLLRESSGSLMVGPAPPASVKMGYPSAGLCSAPQPPASTPPSPLVPAAPAVTAAPTTAKCMPMGRTSRMQTALAMPATVRMEL